MTNEVQCREIDVAIVSDHFWSLDSKCPHCNSYETPEMVEYVDERGFEIVADLMICEDCKGLFFLVESPILLSPFPIMTRWKIPDKIR